LLKRERPGLLVVFGGAHATFFPETIIREKAVDAVCVGEGEGAILDLANACDQKQDIRSIPNLWVRIGDRVFKNPPRLLVQDLDTLPFPDRTHYHDYPLLRNSPWKAVNSGRGCPFNCSFCFNESYNKIYGVKGLASVRKRSTRNIADEINKLAKEWPTKEIHFWDDAFNVKKDWLKCFVEEYPRLCRLPFRCDLRIDLVAEAEISALAQAGCRKSLFGLESGNEHLRKTLLKKTFSNQTALDGARMLRRHKIRFGTFNMLGLPDETLQNAFETVAMNITMQTDYPWCSIVQPYPNTELHRIACSKNLIDARRPLEFPISFFRKSVFAQPDTRKIERLQRLFYFAVKNPRLFPLVKKAVHFPLGPISFLIFAISQVRRHQQTYSMAAVETLRFAIGMLRSYFRMR
jgi:radical SAM superfamily enzyme YgiQ (UPF0313 family)